MRTRADQAGCNRPHSFAMVDSDKNLNMNYYNRADEVFGLLPLSGVI